MDYDPSFGRWLQQRRKALDLTQEELGQCVACSTDHIRNIEADRRRPSKEIAERLVECLAIAPEDRLAFLRFARGESSTILPKSVERTMSVPGRQPPRPRMNLPAQSTAFIGREREVAAVCALLRRPDIRLVTLVGVGGVGKTRLALQAAAELRNTFKDGVFFVALAPISDPKLVPSTIAQTLGVMEISGQPLVEGLKHALRNKLLLLVLDNFEQVLPAAELITELLAVSQLKMLVTSRAVLHLSGEHEFPVPPLTLPDPKCLLPVESLTQYEAVRLITERAQAVKPDFAVTNANAPAVVEICHRLDGLPLALELAAARIKILPPQALLTRLSSRLTLLTGGARDLPARQQTLRNTIDWSYSLLDASEQTLFARLAVFVGGCTLEAAEAVCNAASDLPMDLLDGMASLVDKSLLHQEEWMEGEPHFRMLETIREYALEQLVASGAAEALQRQHAEYYLALAEPAERALLGPQAVAWLNRLDGEHDNLRAGLRWSLERGEVEIALRLAGALRWFWYARGYLSEGRRWLEAALARSSALPASERAKALSGAGSLARLQGDYTGAKAFFEESLALYREVGHTWGLAATLLSAGMLALYQGDHAQAKAFYDESLMLFQEVEDTWGVAFVLFGLGVLASHQGDHARATALLEESLALRRELGDKWGSAGSLNNLGLVALNQGDPVRAKTFFEESLALYREFWDRRNIAEVLEGLAEVAGTQRKAERAVRLFGAAKALRDDLGAPPQLTERPRYKCALSAARAQLHQAAFAAAWAEGRTMPLEQAIVYALEEEGGQPQPVCP